MEDVQPRSATFTENSPTDSKPQEPSVLKANQSAKANQRSGTTNNVKVKGGFALRSKGMATNSSQIQTESEIDINDVALGMQQISN